MLESEESGERTTSRSVGSQNLVYTLPYTTQSIGEFLTPVLSRVDPAAGGTQVVVVSRDAETAITISETVLRLAGPAGIEVVPVTSAARAGRLFKARPVLAVAGTATELSALVKGSLLKLDTVRTIVLAWVDDIADEGAETVAALEALLGELGEAGRVFVTRKATPAVENLIERYARRARRVGIAETEAPQVPEDYELPIIRFVTVGGSARPAALRRLLDDLDPPSAVIVARDTASVDVVRQTVRALGYHDDDSTLRVTQNEFTTAAHTLIFYQPPVIPAELQRVAQARPVQIVVLARPGELPWLRELTSGRLTPLNLRGPERRAHDREEAVRQELRSVLAQGVPAREVISLEPLLEEYDAAELAAAALHVLERERALRRASADNQLPAAKKRPESDARGPGGTTRLFMTIGTRDGVKTADLMAAIAGEGGISGDRVGKIDLRENHALVEVDSTEAEGVITRLNGTSIRGRRVVVRAERDKSEREKSAAPRDRGDRGDRGDRAPRPDRGDRGDRGSRPDRGPRMDRGPRQDRGGPPRSNRGGPPGRSRDRS